MDTTNKNILMCEKAVEIQESDVRHKFGNTVSFQCHENVKYSRASCFILCSSKRDDTARIASQDNRGLSTTWDKLIWLPRQDQLQDMIVNHGGFYKGLSSFGKVFRRLDNFHSSVDTAHKYYGQFDSMEQLWLAFVMKEKYSKLWNGNDWVKSQV